MLNTNFTNITITTDYESDYPYVGNCSAIDPVQDKETEYFISEQLENGNMWAWCQVAVTVTYKGILKATEYLGGCSYDDEYDFITNSGYYDDMVASCIEQIQEQLDLLNTN